MNKADKKFYLETPDPGFSPARNKAVVEESIRKFEAMRKKKYNQAIEQYRERADATVSFIRHVDRGGGNNLRKYFGNKMIAHLRGEEIFADIRLLMANAKEKQKRWKSISS
jgi:hypothetical protein